MHDWQTRARSLIAKHLICLATLTGAAFANAAERPGWSLDNLTHARASNSNGLDTWIEGGVGKLQSERNDSSATILSGFSATYRFGLTSALRVEGAVSSGPGQSIGVTEALWEFKPLSRGAWKPRYKVGAFHNPLSLEHSKEFWQPLYTVSSSMLNAWVGEELRTIGAETQWRWRPRRSSPHQVRLLGALFAGNDSAGAMLSWRGWAAHNRVSFLGETFDLPALPVIQPGAPFASQAPEYEPFVEVDDRVGYYVGASWQYKTKIGVHYQYYDNRGDPLALEDGQYAWDTTFHHLGLKWRPAPGLTLLVQAMTGNTVMGPWAVDNDFSTAFFLLSKSHERHRFTGRVETFDVDDQDFLAVIDPGDESGTRLTLAYRYKFSDQMTLSVEASQMRVQRDYFLVFGRSRSQTEVCRRSASR